MRYRLKDNEAIIHENENTILTDRNIVKESGRFLKKKTMIKLGDIRKKRIEKNNIIISIMRNRKTREIYFMFSEDSIEEVFNKLGKLVTICKENTYRTTTSKYLEDLIDEDDNPYQYKYRKKKVIIWGIPLFLFFSFIFILMILYSMIETGITFPGFFLIYASHYAAHSYFYYLFNRLIFLENDVIYRTFYLFRYRRLNIKKNVMFITPRRHIAGVFVRIRFRDKILKRWVSIPKGVFAVDPMDLDEFEKIVTKSLKYKKVPLQSHYTYEIYKN
ncbi:MULTISPECIES: hypothetical protein [Psychrilyobacter]|uniref:PH domain-containing protein n=1 Tax=Psychrilyobacter piezotolerans TaxID=2293438 RepID=A0ABX9KHX2_9FUSO|nr:MULTISPECIES: hypothetical protein [Psychrilyobacter]MCS5421182.1 hypothetical protein [Psychrilyobacter sp. S5]NDI77627.1 hypothetical protein [Psychrilyobacter piezotolerans]RDE62636.1 hypothetical protein DV867_06565 [Psychrilyobacter sp. S5]REI41566.1 hypothetical protein DYH56_06565 [Psychrilyobacter piezotolerans]